MKSTVGRTCACGCGQVIIPTARVDKRFASDKCRLRGDGGFKGAAYAPAGTGNPALDLAAARTEVARLQAALDRFSTIKPEDTKVPAWVKRPSSTKEHVATGVLVLSDLHFDEVVDPFEMDGVNEYSRETARARFCRVIDSAVELLKTYTAGVHYDGLVVPILGDVISGDIHDEFVRTNEAPTPATVVYWVPKLAAGLVHLADEFGRVYVPVCDGNHDRTYKQIPSKRRAESAWSWVIYNWLADTLRDDDRISFGISTSPEQLIDVYSTTFLLAHGDGFRSQGGVGGLYPAMLKWLLKRHQYYSAVRRDYDYALLGHWHQPLWGTDFVVNGSLVGYNGYARDKGFVYTPAAQQLFTVTPERGIGARLTVHAE